MKLIFILMLSVALAAVSFGYARHHYVSKNSATLTNPFNSREKADIANPFLDKKLFGDWMKDEVVFAIIVPVAVLGAGVVLALKK